MGGGIDEWLATPQIVAGDRMPGDLAWPDLPARKRRSRTPCRLRFLIFPANYTATARAQSLKTGGATVIIASHIFTVIARRNQSRKGR